MLVFHRGGTGDVYRGQKLGVVPGLGRVFRVAPTKTVTTRGEPRRVKGPPADRTDTQRYRRVSRETGSVAEVRVDSSTLFVVSPEG